MMFLSSQFYVINKDKIPPQLVEKIQSAAQRPGQCIALKDEDFEAFKEAVIVIPNTLTIEVEEQKIRTPSAPVPPFEVPLS